MSKSFVEKILDEIYSVTSFSWTESGLCVIERKDMNAFVAGFVWQRKVTLEEVTPLLDSGPKFVTSIPSGAFWDGPAMHVCEENGIGWGGVGTFTSACLKYDPATVTEKTTAFARRIIRQHPNVASLYYINSLCFDVQTRSRRVKIALDDAYDLSGDSVRSAWETLGPFDALFKNNPNGQITPDARQVAKTLNVETLDAKSIFKYLWK